jgi:glutathione S-transferase
VNIKLKQDLPEWFAKEINPSRSVPVIQLPDGRVLTESMVISEFLDEVYPMPLRLSDPYAHAQEKLAVDTFSKSIPFITKLSMSQDSFEEISAKLNETLVNFVNIFLKDRDFLGGKLASFADFMVWPWLERLEYLEKYKSVKINESIGEILHQYSKRMKEYEAVRAQALPTGSYFKFYESSAAGKPNWDAHFE